jgi:hypothetical protein
MKSRYRDFALIDRIKDADLPVIPSCAPLGNRGQQWLEESIASDDAKPSNRFAQDTSSPPEQFTRWRTGWYYRRFAAESRPESGHKCLEPACVFAAAFRVNG